MLDLGQIVAEIESLAAETTGRALRLRGQVAVAVSQARMPQPAWREQFPRIAQSETRWLTAIPHGDPPASIATRIPPPAPPARYTALATDGSQIPLDRHEIAPCYVINIGEIALHYGADERPRLSTRASLYYKDADVLLDQDKEPSYVTDREIATRRMLAEASLLQGLIAEHAARANPVALVDGTLILWAQEAEPDETTRRVVGEFVGMLERARDAGVPVAGYISAPGSRDVVNALRVTLCPESKVNCHKCPYKNALGNPLPCEPIKGVTDSALFDSLLSPGERSPLFLSQSRVLQLYPPDQQIAFFYLHVGAEIARVEAPLWVAENPALLERVHALAFDQAQKGGGYPVCLAEAHERAVVRTQDREAFFVLVARSLARRQAPVLTTRKALAKRTRIL